MCHIQTTLTTQLVQKEEIKIHLSRTKYYTQTQTYKKNAKTFQSKQTKQTDKQTNKKKTKMDKYIRINSSQT